ncbi:MAG: hypothetical protein R3Y19_00460 [Rikenellaceae bacterium]
MKRYLIRFLKYIVYFVLLLGAMLLIMNSFGDTISFEAYKGERGLMLIGAIIFFSLIYPFIGFTRKTLTVNASNRVEEVERILAMCGYKRVNADNENMEFEGASFSKKLITMWEDKVTITTQDGVSVIVGSRKEIVKIAYRITSYL